MSIIVLDPGHGGSDPGAVSGARQEKNDNLRLGLALRQRLQAPGNQVIMTRSTDVFVPLTERSNISNRANADIFVSLHRNAFTNTTANGVETWVQTGVPLRTAANAHNVQNEIVAVGVQSNRGVRFGNYVILRNTRAPAMMQELGFITNARDNQLFDQHFNAYADAIANGILLSLGQPIPPSASNAIASIQRTLNTRYNAGLTVDGRYSPATRSALVAGLQTELNRAFNANLAVNGVFDAATRAAITRGLRRGDRGNWVYILQASLFVNGFSPGMLDGSFGPMTDAALRNFQSVRGLAADGIAGPVTFTALLGPVAAPPPPPPPPQPSGTITLIQRTLNRRYNAGLAEDGTYGPATRKALITGLQLELNCTFGRDVAVDGVFSPATRAAITRGLRLGDRGNWVYILQASLFVNGYSPGPLDGSFGPLTQATVRAFQAARNLVVDGIAGPATFTALLDPVAS